MAREVIYRGVPRDGVVAQEDESVSQSGIKFLSSWIQHGVGVGLEESMSLLEPLLAVTRNPNLSESSLEALTHLVNHPEAHRYPNLLMGMLNHLLSLQDQLEVLRYPEFVRLIVDYLLKIDLFVYVIDEKEI